MEIVHDGWLLKSPPPKRLWRAKWRNRWFVLRSGELPGQYFLEYYTDDTRKKLKGKIDLDHCEQVDAGITFAHRKFEYKYMFDIKTPKRVYYLCAETEEAMNRWVDCVCQVCGLKVMSQEDMTDPLSQFNPASIPSTPQTAASVPLDLQRLLEYPCVDSPPPSASSTISGPYIPISECITGRKNSNPTRFPFVQESSQMSPNEENQRSSIPNEMAPPAPIASLSSTNNSKFSVQRKNSHKGTKLRESYDAPRHLLPSSLKDLQNGKSAGTDGAYVFVSEEEKLTMQKENASEEKEIHKKNHGVFELENPPPFAPPRPPKPAHLTEVVQQNYMNLGTVYKPNKINSGEKSRKTVAPPSLPFPESSISSSDAEPSPASVASSTVSSTSKTMSEDLYDFPRSHQAELVCSTSSTTDRGRRHCYNNSAPTLQGKIFSYDIQQPQVNEKSDEIDPRISPLGIYSNIPQINNSASYIPPVVNRGLKPKKNESSSFSASELSPPPSGGTVSDIPSCSSVALGMPVPPASAPPIIDRNLKPHKKSTESTIFSLIPPASPLVLDPAPRSRVRHTDQRKQRAAPSPTPPALQNGVKEKDGSDSDEDSSISSPSSQRDSIAEEQVFFPLYVVQRRSSHEIQYLDLDLESAQSQATSSSPKATLKNSGMSKIAPSEPSVVYKKVDFMKTKAFNKMRQNVEEGYRTGKTTN